MPILEKRLNVAYDRVKGLEAMGLEMGKVRTIIQNLEKEAPTQKKDNILEALGKLEGYLERVEQIARKKEGGGKMGEGPEKVPEDMAVSEVGGPPPQGTVPEPPSEVGQDKPQTSFDWVKVRSDRELITRLCEEVVSKGGDTSPIDPHLNAMNEAEGSKDGVLFDQYCSIVLEWLTAYLGNIYRSSMTNDAREIEGFKGDFIAIGREQDIRELLDAASSRAEVPADAPLEDIRGRAADMASIRTSITERHTGMVKEISENLRDLVKLIRKMISELPEGERTEEFRGSLDSVEQTVQTGEVLKGFKDGRALKEEIGKELADRSRARLEKMILSVEPLMEKISLAHGGTSELFTSLNGEKEKIIEVSKTDIDRALKKMEALLDRVSLAIAEIDERSAGSLSERIREARTKAEDLKDVLDITPIMSILQRADDLATEGDVDTATKMVDRALSAFDKLKERKLLDQAALSLSEIRTKMAELSDKAMDTTPLQGPVDRAKEALDRKDLKAYEEALVLVREKLELLRGEELRVEYHGRLMALMNELNFLRKEGFEAPSLEKKLDEARTFFHERRLKEAVEIEKEIREEMGRIRLKGVLQRRLLAVEGTIKEAEGLLLDMEDVSEHLGKARERMASEELKEALDHVSTAQALAEELLMNRTYSMIEKEVRQMAGELRSFEIDPGDIDSRIRQAYSMVDDERFKEAMESFLQLKDELSRALIDKKAEWTVRELGRKIREARTAGVNISPYKASLTKAKVLLEARDLESAAKVASDQIASIDATLLERRNFQSRLDELRGKLIAYEAKLGQLSKAGVQADDLKERIGSIREFIDGANIDEAEAQLKGLDADIGALLTSNARDRMAQGVRPAFPVAVPVQGAVAGKAEPAHFDMEADPDEAYEELKIIIKRIQEEMKLLPQKGQRIDEVKKDIVKVQQLVIQKRYVEAYRMASRCYSNIKAYQM